MPYRDFMFFHPPGVLSFFAALRPLTDLWWPAGRVLTMIVDSGTVVLVYLLGRKVFGRASGRAAALVYAFSPLALVSAVRIGQDPLLTFFCMLGLVLLVYRDGRWSSFLAGICLAAAIWIKYPAAIFVPVYALAAPRRGIFTLAGLLSGLCVAFAPFAAVRHDLYFQTVTFQRTRWLMAPDQRIETVLLWWLAATPPAVVGLFRRNVPVWIRAGYLMGAVFILSPQVYYHYYVPIVPFAALLSGPVIAGLSLRSIAGAGALLTAVWAFVIVRGGPSPLYVTAAHLSDVWPAVRFLERTTPAHATILTDRYEYPYLARRSPLDHYFWNVGVLVTPQHLEARVGHARAVVMSYGASSGYPLRFVQYLNAHWHAHNLGATSIWLLDGA